MFKTLSSLALLASASAFAPAVWKPKMGTKVFQHIGAGGMADTRDPDALEHDDARKSIGVAPSFEEYMKQRSGAPAPAPAAAAPAAAAPAAAAPAPVAAPAAAAGSFQYGEYNDKLWDNDAKKIIYAKWDPNAPRTTMNFNPFETFEGNSPDASGIYPGETFYKDPMRGDVSYAKMQVEKAEIEERNANPKPGHVPGCPGCKDSKQSGAPAPAAAAPAAAAPAPAAAPAAPAAPAAAAPAAAAGSFQYGEYDGKLWDNDAKKIIYAKWDPNAPRSTLNFNPFETFDGNSPDASGIFPGEKFYKDPLRGDVSYATMQVEKAEIEERNANPKPGYVPGCAGCKN